MRSRCIENNNDETASVPRWALAARTWERTPKFFELPKDLDCMRFPVLTTGYVLDKVQTKIQLYTICIQQQLHLYI